ncbi:MAG: hypothetical protein ABFC62_10180 [Clostridiaceae bacterium]|nr:hypothetical protein [Eubacteriales bacterium]
MEERNPKNEELLQKMRAAAQLMEDDLLSESMEEYESTGKLTSPKLCEKSTEYENYLLSISQLEKQLREREEKK